MTLSDIPPHVLIFAACAVLALLGPPLLNRYLLYLARRRALPEWDGFASEASSPTTRPASAFRSVDLSVEHSEGPVQVEGRVVRRVQRWWSWETRVSMRAPEEWPADVELYGKRAVRWILGFRNRVEIDPDFDRIVLTRRTHAESVDKAHRALGDGNLRHEIRRRFSDEPRLMVRDGRIEIIRRGLSNGEVLQADIERITGLHARLGSMVPRHPLQR